MTLSEALTQNWDCLVLPGGEEGAHNLQKFKPLTDALMKRKAAGQLCAASEFAPAIVFGSIPGFLQPGATCHPLRRLRKMMPTASDNDVVWQAGVVTCQGIGPAVIFSFLIAELLLGPLGPKIVTDISISTMVDREGTSGYRYFPPHANPAMRVKDDDNSNKVRDDNNSNKSGTASTSIVPKASKEQMATRGDLVNVQQSQAPVTKNTSSREKEVVNSQTVPAKTAVLPLVKQQKVHFFLAKSLLQKETYPALPIDIQKNQQPCKEVAAPVNEELPTHVEKQERLWPRRGCSDSGSENEKCENKSHGIESDHSSVRPDNPRERIPTSEVVATMVKTRRGTKRACDEAATKERKRKRKNEKDELSVAVYTKAATSEVKVDSQFSGSLKSGAQERLGGIAIAAMTNGSLSAEELALPEAKTDESNLMPNINNQVTLRVASGNVQQTEDTQLDGRAEKSTKDGGESASQADSTRQRKKQPPSPVPEKSPLQKENFPLVPESHIDNVQDSKRNNNTTDKKDDCQAVFTPSQEDHLANSQPELVPQTDEGAEMTTGMVESRLQSDVELIHLRKSPEAKTSRTGQPLAGTVGPQGRPPSSTGPASVTKDMSSIAAAPVVSIEEKVKVSARRRIHVGESKSGPPVQAILHRKAESLNQGGSVDGLGVENFAIDDDCEWEEEGTKMSSLTPKAISESKLCHLEAEVKHGGSEASPGKAASSDEQMNEGMYVFQGSQSSDNDLASSCECIPSASGRKRPGRYGTEAPIRKEKSERRSNVEEEETLPQDYMQLC